MTSRAPLVDPFGRRIDYVRLSVTDRCNFRCVYCMPEDGIEWTERSELLSFEETEQLARVLTQCGVRRIRLTGGEPTVRRGIVDLVARISGAKEHGLRDLAMTTNGWNLAQIGPDLRAAGLDRLNISLDTLDRERFVQITRTDRLADVLAGIDAVVAMDWLPLKINVVVCDGINEDEAVAFVDRFADLPVHVRYIEYMAFGESRFKLVPWARVRAQIEGKYRLVDVPGPEGSGPADYWRVEGTNVTVGAIGALSRQFCAACNRIRITADGQIRNCLAYEPDMVSVRDVLRGGGTDDDLEHAIRAALLAKPFSHIQQQDGSNPYEGNMIQIGG
jgi:cyclic pyranopterin phosphate synthase